MKIVNSWYGHSLILNVSLVCANVIGLIFFFAAFSPLFEDYKIAFVELGEVELEVYNRENKIK